MRVIAGSYKGQSLEAVQGNVTRPTSDKVKEAVFQIMGPFFASGTCFDLFAGSGALGLEALSRGIDQAIFVDTYPKAIHTIRQNVRKLGVGEQSDIYRTDAFQALKATAKRGLSFDLIFIDPPYQKVNYDKLLDAITSQDLLNTNGLLYCEHERTQQLAAPSNQLVTLKERTYNDATGVTIFQGN